MVIVLKTELNGDLRRIPLHNDFLTFDELHLMLCRVYSCDIDEEDKLKYMDEDGDWVTIQDSSDLQFAIQCVQQRNETTLKLRIGGNQAGLPDEIVNELKSIRDMSISLLDRVAASGGSSQKSASPAKSAAPVNELPAEIVEEPVQAPEPIKSADIKSFDPIQGNELDSGSNISSKFSMIGESTEEAISYVEPTQAVAPVAPVTIQNPEPAPVAIQEPVIPSQVVEPIQHEPVPTPIVPVVPITPVQETPQPIAVQESVAPVQPAAFAPTDQTSQGAASFFNSNQSDAGDSFNMSDRGSSAATPKPVLPPSNPSPAPVAPPSNPQPNHLHGQQQYNYNAYMSQQQMPQTAPSQQPVSQPQPPAQQPQQHQPQQHQPQAHQQNQYYQQYQHNAQYAQTAGYGQYYQQQGYGQGQQQQQPQQPQAPTASAPPAGPPQGMPAGGYRLNRNTRNVRPGYQ